MARATFTKSSRKPHTCGRTGHEIPAGEGYWAASPGYRGREIYRCSKHPFRPSELTTSLRSEPLAAIEAFEDAIGSLDEGDWEGLRQAHEDLVGALEEYAGARADALDAWENGNSQLEDLAEIADAALSQAEDLESEIEAPGEPDTDDPDFDADEYALEVETAWADAIAAAEELAGSLEV